MSEVETRLMRKSLALIALAGSSIAVPAAAQVPSPAPAAAETAGQDQGRVLPWLKLEDLSATRDRPLFAPDRRPPPLPPVAAPPAVSVAQPEEVPDTRPNLSLKGIIRQDSAILIVLEDNATSESIIVRSGDSYGRWRVIAESDDSVKLADGSEELRLTLFQP
jgi:general secretion pathway protein N